MRKADSPLVSWWHVVFFLTALLVVTADQLSKIWIRSYPLGHLINKIGFIEITHIRNTGSAFGTFQGQSLALTIVGLAEVAVILVLAFYIYRRFPLLANIPNRIALGLILGGAVGNLIDRLSLGYVTDFVDVGFWPVFNIADSAVVVGVIIAVYSLLRYAINKNADLST